MDKSILLPGRVGNIGEWYNIADLFVLTSEFEGFPNALIEAMSYGVPAVSYDCETGPSDIIRHDIDGILVSNGDMLALKNSLKKLMYDDKLRKRYSEKSIEVRERFSLNEVIKNPTEIRPAEGTEDKDQLYPHLYEFCINGIQAKKKPEIRGGLCWTENGYHYFLFPSFFETLPQHVQNYSLFDVQL